MTKSDYLVLMAMVLLAPHIHPFLSGIFAVILFVTASFTEDKA